MVSWFAKDVDVLLGKGDGSFAPPTTTATMREVGSLALADFDGDRKLDLFTVEGAGAVWMRPGKGDGTFGAEVGVGNGAWEIAVVDVTGDGKVDVVTTIDGRYQNFLPAARIYVAGCDRPFEPAYDYQQQSGTRYLLAADLDLDGRPDLLTGGTLSLGVPTRNDRVTVIRNLSH